MPMDVLNWIFNGLSMPWCIVEVVLTSLVICIMVRNVETWSDKFKEKHSTPLPLVLLITLCSCVLCFLIDFLWNLWVIYDLNTGSWSELLSSAHVLFNNNITAYVVLSGIICLICGIYFICLKAYRISGIILLVMGVIFGVGGYILGNHMMDMIVNKYIHRIRFPNVKY